MMRESGRILAGVAWLPWLTLSFSGLAIGLYALAGPAAAGAVYDRAAVADGDWWLLVSAHWIHSDAGHLAWNVGALLLLGSIVEAGGRRLLPLGLLAGTVAVDLLLWWGVPEMSRYCGLSGVLNTLLVIALWTAWRRSNHWIPWAVGVASLLKIVAESSSGQALLTQTAWAGFPMAHLAGWLAGCMLVMLARSRGALPR
jgi:rhomboid family GlyGly-CTERM serine protease